MTLHFLSLRLAHGESSWISNIYTVTGGMWMLDVLLAKAGQKRLEQVAIWRQKSDVGLKHLQLL